MSAELKTIALPSHMGTRKFSPSIMLGSRAGHGDARWPEIAAVLADLREKKRCAVRIVDADCGCGTLLIDAARHARALGFTAIEGRGIDGSPSMIGRARAAAARFRDPAIGLEFEMADMETALSVEADFPADIVLWHGSRTGNDRPGVVRALGDAGDRIIGDPVAGDIRRQAA